MQQMVARRQNECLAARQEFGWYREAMRLRPNVDEGVFYFSNSALQPVS